MDLVILLAACREHNDRDLFELADFPAGGKAIQFRHHHIQYDQIKIFFPADFNCFHSVMCLRDLISFKFPIFSNDRTDLVLIVYN